MARMYSECLKIAGCRVIEFVTFGTYQGNWVALVDYNGKKGWIIGSYGSCTGCDSFQSEFGHSTNHCCTDGKWKNEYDYNQFSMAKCDKCKELYSRLKAFGENYVEQIMTQEEAEKEASRNISWDLDAQPMLDFIQQNKIGEDINE